MVGCGRPVLAESRLREMTIEKALIEDLPEILNLQKLAFQIEAELYNDYSIPLSGNPGYFSRQQMGTLICLRVQVSRKVSFSKIETINTKHTLEEVFNIFSSGAIAGYLNQEFYDIELPKDYDNNFRKIIRNAFEKQADSANNVDLIFNRIYLVAEKE